MPLTEKGDVFIGLALLHRPSPTDASPTGTLASELNTKYTMCVFPNSRMESGDERTREAYCSSRMWWDQIVAL